MDKTNEIIYDFSNLTANEVEIETSDDTTKTKAKPKIETPFFEPSDYSNGAIYEQENYCWSQTFNDIGNYCKHNTLELTDIIQRMLPLIDYFFISRNSHSTAGKCNTKKYQSKYQDFIY